MGRRLALIMFLAETAEALKQHAARFDLENRAVEFCKEYLRNYSAEYPEEVRFYLRGYAIEELEFQFVNHQLVFRSYRSWPHILSRVDIGLPGGSYSRINLFATYELETVEDGEINDDWFAWDEMRDENGKLIEFSGEN